MNHYRCEHCHGTGFDWEAFARDLEERIVATQNPDRMAYSRREAAHLLGVSPDTIDKMVAKGELYAREAGGRTLIPRAALEAWLRQPEEAAPCPTPTAQQMLAPGKTAGRRLVTK